MKGHLSSGYSFRLASTARQSLQEDWTRLLSPRSSLLKEQLKVELTRTGGGGVAPVRLLPAPRVLPLYGVLLTTVHSQGTQDKGACWIFTFLNEDNQSYSVYRRKPMSGKSNKPYQLLGGIGRQRGRGAGGSFFPSPDLWEQILE